MLGENVVLGRRHGSDSRPACPGQLLNDSGHDGHAKTPPLPQGSLIGHSREHCLFFQEQKPEGIFRFFF